MRSLVYILISLPYLALGQTNLVPNSSFEQHLTCPSGSSQLEMAIPWITPTLGSPEYFHSCATSSGYEVPSNTVGYQAAHDGVAYCGIYAFSFIQHNLREYVQIELTDSIIKGIPYHVSFYTSLSDNFRYSVNTLGIYFSQEQISRSDVYKFDYTPQIINNSNNPLTSKDEWMLVTDTFISNDGGEKYITIGNFNDDNNSDTIAGDTGAVYAYYYIDDVSVIALDTTIGIGEDEQINFSVYPTPSNKILNIELQKKKDYDLKLTDLQGKVIYALPFDYAQGDKYAIDVSGFANGIYLLTLENEEERTTVKVVVQH